MSQNLRSTLKALQKRDWLITVDTPISPDLELPTLSRLIFDKQGPALLFNQVAGTKFPVVSNLFGHRERMNYLFEPAIPVLRALFALKADPGQLAKEPRLLWPFLQAAWRAWPRWTRHPAVYAQRTSLSQLPQLRSWPQDGGAFVTLPAVYSEDPLKPGWRQSNLGMYRIQLSGNDYLPDAEMGLHYQLHRGIGVHHTQARRAHKPFPMQVFVGGSPAAALAAVMPLPEGLTELFMVGLLAGCAQAWHKDPVFGAVLAQADFCLQGFVDDTQLKPEGPFGDHLGYYSLKHDFPVVRVERVWNRRDAIWPYTTVGRPPQEDSLFGSFIHDLTREVIPSVLPGVRAVHAVDAACVHPLLLALGSERYTPYTNETRPQELLTQAMAILGHGQLSLAKYLWIANQADAPDLNLHHIQDFFGHMLGRIDWQRDLHFITETTMDTLDYSAGTLNCGSKMIAAARGPARFALASELKVPNGWTNASPHLALPGVLVLQMGPFDSQLVQTERKEWTDRLENQPWEGIRLVVFADDAEFTARTLDNFLWVTFTRSDPARDVFGVGETQENKHWGCRGPLCIDARLKPWHPPVVEEDPQVVARVQDKFLTRGKPLARCG